MAALTLTWDNTNILANPNVVAVRALWRLKIIGGTFYTTGFSPANDLSPLLNTVDFTGFTVNKLYEFKVQSICSAGGPTDNTNGIEQGIVFGCILPVLESTNHSVTVDIDVTGTEIAGADITLKKQSDNSEIETTGAIDAVANHVNFVFDSGVVANTGYYVEIMLYTLINDMKVFIDVACGGNVTGYQITTLP